MSETTKMDNEESRAFFMNPMNLYGVGGIPFPIFTPQFGPMVPLRMMTPMWPMNAMSMQPYTEKPLSDTPDTMPVTDQPANKSTGGKIMPFTWPMNTPCVQQYMKSMNASMLKSSSDMLASTSPGTMMAPMWPMNVAFMQQYMEGFSGHMPKPVIKSATPEQSMNKVSAKKESIAAVTTASLVSPPRDPSETVQVKKTGNIGSDNSVKAGGVSADKPKAEIAINNNDKMAEMTFPTGLPFMPFSNIAGFIPYTTYIPYFKPVDVEQSGSTEKEQLVEPSKTQVPEEPDSGSTEQALEEHRSGSSIPVEVEQEPVQVTSLKDEPSDDDDESRHGLNSVPSDSNCSEEDKGNSAEMDVARILVNFMPVPIISNASQDDVDDGNQQDDTSVVVMEEGTAPLAMPNIYPSAATENCEPALSSEALPDSATGIIITNEDKNQECLDSSKSQISQAKSLVQNSMEVIPKVDSMEVSVIKSSRDVVMEMKEFNTRHDRNMLEGKVTTPLEMEQEERVCEGNEVTQGVYDGQVKQHVCEGHEIELAFEVKQEYDQMDEKPVLGDVADTNEEIPRIGKVTFKCEVCSQLFRSSLGLQKHLEFHTDDGQHYTCTICFERFQNSASLQEHIAYHMRKRPHKCQFCPKAFRDPGSLQKHVRVHTGEKPYKCTNCFRSFAEYSSLRKHLRVHTGEQPYKCQYCSKAFSISGNLQRHVLIHTGERPYKCSFCPKAFNNPSHLRRHVKNLHFKGEGGSGADVMIAMAAAVAAAEGKVALGNSEMTEGPSLTVNEAGSSGESFSHIVPYTKDRDQTALVGDQSMIINMDFPAAIGQPVNIK